MLSGNLERLVLQYFEDLGCSYSLKCHIMWRHGEFEALARLDCRPTDYGTPKDYFKAASALAVVKKLRGFLDNGDERRERAVAKWFEGEASCYRTNLRLFCYLPGNHSLGADASVHQHLAGIREVVRELIGDRPPVLLAGKFGPGATFANRGLRVTVPHKIHSDPTLTSDAVWFLPQFLGTAWGRSLSSTGNKLSFVRGCRFTTVPKTSYIDRSIAIEPSINVFYQLAVGSALRTRLRERGWDLDYAQDVHRQVAKESSVTREFATLDLSNASDTVAINLVKLMLPHAWYEIMADLRSPYVTHPAKPGKAWIKLEKFSSMGNGFTFELETVLFAAIACYASRQAGERGVLGKDVFCFGDDIIVKDGAVRGVNAALNFLGFALNKEKSYWGDTPFRESCGADFMSGLDVRPVYLKEEPSNVQAMFGVANRFHTTGVKLAALGERFPSRSWHSAVSEIPVRYRRSFGPPGLGDNVIWQTDQTQWRVRWRNSIRYIQGLRPGDRAVTPFSQFPPEVVLACATYGTGNEGTPVGGRVPAVEGVIPRSPIRSYVLGWLPYS